MNINKTGSIRKGFAFSKMLFPAVGAFLWVTQSGCGQSLGRLGAGAAQPCSQVVAGSSNDKILRLAKASGNYLLEGDAFSINKTMVAVMGGSKQFQEIQKRYGLSPLSTSSQAGSIFLAKREKPEGIGCPAFEARKNLVANLLVT